MSMHRNEPVSKSPDSVFEIPTLNYFFLVYLAAVEFLRAESDDEDMNEEKEE